MIINLTKSVPLKEVCKISAIGHTTKNAELIEFGFSHEALIGFATELIWLYEDMQGSEKPIIETYTVPSPNQAIGFYLTPSSPMFVLKINTLPNEKLEECENINYKEIRIHTKNKNQYYNVKLPDEQNALEYNGYICMEPYELSYKNIVNIRVLDENNDDITKHYSTINFEINYNGIKELATMLLVLANNYKNGQEYELAHMGQMHDGYNMGVILMQDSKRASFKCVDLGTIDDYEYQGRL